MYIKTTSFKTGRHCILHRKGNTNITHINHKNKKKTNLGCPRTHLQSCRRLVQLCAMRRGEKGVAILKSALLVWWDDQREIDTTQSEKRSMHASPSNGATTITDL